MKAFNELNPEVIGTLIIEDDLIEQKGLKILLEHHPQFCILGTARSVKEAVTLIQKSRPELIFLDLQLQDGCGLDILQRVISNEYKPCIICTTAYDNFAINSIKFSVFDYLIKPILQDDLTTPLERFLKERKERQLSLKLVFNCVS